ncbi:four helix bundle suffix domain-containing protein [Desulfonatronovibrio magnus]|uniref:four helix bundle suffix domain-containing protein n=1 Tax=Desulfonatronovibrio magnus TaxID=698827 RepID=UPI0009FE958F|nr:four helix bundle suffix domain-containing protein [Desulfonatronovibrio magnus]
MIKDSIDRLIPAHGGFRKLRSFVVSLAVYDGTVIFCDRFVPRMSRTKDQMVQAARSGVQNIAEGSLGSAASRKIELKLTSIARASLGELIRDYEDYLCQNNLKIWHKDSSRVLKMRARLAGKLPPPAGSPDIETLKLSSRGDVFDEPLLAALHAMKTVAPEVSANVMLCMTHQASFLLARQLQRLEKDFLEQGGFTERMYRMRQASRKKGFREDVPVWPVKREESDRSDKSDWSDRSDF